MAEWGERPRQLVPTERHPEGYQEQPLLIFEHNATRAFRRSARREFVRAAAHLPPGAQRVALTLASDATVDGAYFWSQERIARRAGLSRPHTNRYLKLLAENGLIEIPAKQRKYHHPKTIKFSQRLILRVMERVFKLVRCQGDSRGPKDPVASSRPHFPTRSFDKILSRFRRKRRYRDGFMVCCPCHDDRTPSLCLSKAEDGRILAHCFAGCSYEDLRDRLGLGGTWEQRYQSGLDDYLASDAYLRDRADYLAATGAAA